MTCTKPQQSQTKREPCAACIGSSDICFAVSVTGCSDRLILEFSRHSSMLASLNGLYITSIWGILFHFVLITWRLITSAGTPLSHCLLWVPGGLRSRDFIFEAPLVFVVMKHAFLYDDVLYQRHNTQSIFSIPQCDVLLSKQYATLQNIFVCFSSMHVNGCKWSHIK